MLAFNDVRACRSDGRHRGRHSVGYWHVYRHGRLGGAQAVRMFQ